MKANELRIGNLVFMSREKEPKYKGYHGRVFNFDLIDYIEHLHPIPLTKDWMLRCGFKCRFVLDGHVWICDKFLIFESNKGKFELSWGRAIDSVHQLQNIYHAYHGEELTYTQHSKCTCAYESQYRNCSKRCERDND
jgi:hypothetical protein